jgi:hypothetical protein
MGRMETFQFFQGVENKNDVNVKICNWSVTVTFCGNDAHLLLFGKLTLEAFAQ